jgi:predicted RNA-binding Zn ribbon-like protein
MERGPSVPLSATPQADTCLDYANTRMWRGTATPVEVLDTLPALLDWIAGPAGLSEGTVASLRAWADADPARAGALLAEAVALRELVYRVLAAVGAGARVAEADLAALNKAVAEAPPRARLARLSGGYGWEADPVAPTAPALLAPVLWSVADLLVQAARHRLRQCANPECGWLFIDASKNGTRRWCDMTACGNRAKARRHYERSKAG